MAARLVLLIVFVCALSGCREPKVTYHDFIFFTDTISDDVIYDMNHDYDYCSYYEYAFQYYELLDYHNNPRGSTLDVRAIAYKFNSDRSIILTRLEKCYTGHSVRVGASHLIQGDAMSDVSFPNYLTEYIDTSGKWTLNTRIKQPTELMRQYHGSRIGNHASEYVVTDNNQMKHHIDAFVFNKGFQDPYILPKKSLIFNPYLSNRGEYAGAGFVGEEDILYISTINLETKQNSYYQITMENLFDLGFNESLVLHPLKTNEFNLARIKDTRKPFKGPSSLETKGDSNKQD